MRKARSANDGSPPALVFWLLGGCLWLLLCAPVLAPSVQLGDRDTARLYYPVKRFIAEGLAHGELRFWDPQAEGGVSLLGQVTPGLLHPLTLLYAALPFELAFKLNHLLALLLGGAGAFLLARRLGAARWSALVAGVAFGGCGPLVSAASGNLPFALGPATVPLALAGLIHLCDGPRPLRLLASGAALALCAFAGDPQSLGLAILIGVPWAGLRGAWRPGLAWAALGLLLSAPVALPALLQLRRTARFEGVSAIETASFATSPQRLLGLLVPRAFDGDEPSRATPGDTFSEYLGDRSTAPFLESILFGAPALLLALCAGRRGLYPLLAALVLLGAATGDALPLHALLSLLPGWRVFRFAEKLLLPACALLAVAAALGAERTLRERQPGRLLQHAIVLSGALGVALLAVRLGRDPLLASLQQAGRTHSPALAARFLGALDAGLLQALLLSAAMGLVALFAVRRERPDLACAGAALLCAAGALASPALRTVPVDLFHRPSTTGALVRSLAGEGARVWVDASGPLLVPGDEALPAQEARLLGAREALWPQLQALDGLEGLAPYFSAPDARFIRALQGAREAVFRLLGVRAEIFARDAGGPAGLPASDSGYRVLLRTPLPRAFLVHRARVAQEETALAAADLEQEALVDSPLQLDGAGHGTARRAGDTIEVETSGPALLLAGDRFDPGWRATVDGQPAGVIAADFVALGVPVPAGRHQVSLRFRPRGLREGVAVALAAAALLLLAAWRARP